MLGFYDAGELGHKQVGLPSRELFKTDKKFSTLVAKIEESKTEPYATKF
jgi:hypothetical protein